MTGVHIYNTAVSRRQYTKQANQSTCERISQGVSVHALSTLDSLSANRLSVYLQSELSLLSKASGPSARRVSADLQPMTPNLPTNYVRTPRVVRVVQCPFLPLDHQKPQYVSDFFTTMSSGPMRIRNCGSEEKNELGEKAVSVKERYGICIGPPDHRRKIVPTSSGFRWSSGKIGHWTTRTSAKGVIV